MELVRCKEKLHDVDFYKARMEVSGQAGGAMRWPSRPPDTAPRHCCESRVLGGSERSTLQQPLLHCHYLGSSGSPRSLSLFSKWRVCEGGQISDKGHSNFFLEFFSLPLHVCPRVPVTVLSTTTERNFEKKGFISHCSL